jgi:hypothetical protein
MKTPILTILGLRTLLAYVPLFLAVSASHFGHIARLIAFLGHVALLATVAAFSAAALRAILGKVTDCND